MMISVEYIVIYETLFFHNFDSYEIRFKIMKKKKKNVSF